MDKIVLHQIPELHLQKPDAQIREINFFSDDTCAPRNNDNIIRVWHSQYPKGFTFQIRTYKPITDSRKGKPRNMIATTIITIEDIKEILAFMEKEALTVK